MDVTNAVELTDEEKKYIRDNWANQGDQVMAEHLGRNRNTIMRYRVKNNLYKSQKKIDEHNYKELTDPEVETPNIIKAPQAETIEPTSGAAAEIFKADNQKTKKDVEKFIPKEYLPYMSKVTDKFVMIRKSLDDKEWPIFLSHWLRYLETYKDLLEVGEDFDDLVGIIRELILQDRLFAQGKDKKLSSADTKQYNDSIKRQTKFKDTLQKHVDERKKDRQLGADAFSDIVRLFDSHKAREAMVAADKADYDELKTFMDLIEEKMQEAKDGADGALFDGNEETLMLGISPKQIDEIVTKSHNILKADDLTEFEVGKTEETSGSNNGE